MSRLRKTRRDAKLERLTPEQRAAVESWLAEDGAQSCLQRLSSELGLTVSQATLYESLARWRAQRKFSAIELIARSQAEQEAAAKGGMTVAQMEEAIDRHFISLAAVAEDTELYKELRYLRIADQTAKTNAQIGAAKLRQKDKQLSQKDADLQLAERRVKILEERERKTKEVLEDKTIDAATQAARIREIFGKA